MFSGLLPSINGALALTPDQGNWLLISYLCANISVLPISPWLSRYFGKRTYFLTSIAGFGLCSLLCVFSTSLAVLLPLRILQGAFGGGLIATSHAAFRQAFPASRLGVSQVAFVGSFVGGPLTFGPLISGIIVDGNYPWQWMFIVDSAIAAIAFALCWRFLKGDDRRQDFHLDYVGAILFAGFAIPIQYLFVEGERYNWLDDPNIMLLIALSGICLIGLVVWHVRERHALFSDALRLNRNSAIVAILLVPVGLCLSAGVAVAVEFTERLLTFTGTLTGEMLVVRALAFLPLTLLAGIVMDKRSPRARVPVAIGIALLAAGFALQWQWATTDTSFVLIVIALSVSGLGIGPAIVPLLWWLFRLVPRHRTNGVTALVDTALAIGTTSALGLVPTAIDHRFAVHYVALQSSVTRPHLLATKLQPTPRVIHLLAQLVTQQSYALAFADVALLLMLVALVSIPLVLLFKQKEASVGF